MKKVKASSKNFESKLHELLADYYEGVEAGTLDLIEETAKETVEELKRTSPKDSGDYAKSWQVANTSRSRYQVRLVICNKRYQLTHLLEYGHQVWSHGKRVNDAKPKPHIFNAEQNAKKKILKGIERVAK